MELTHWLSVENDPDPAFEDAGADSESRAKSPRTEDKVVSTTRCMSSSNALSRLPPELFAI